MIDLKSVFEFHTAGNGSHADCFKLVWAIPKDLPYFQGHFPGQPILPAIAIIDASTEAVKRHLKLDSIYLSEVKSAKFLNPVLPELKVSIACSKMQNGDWSIDWTTNHEGQIESQQVLAKLVLTF